MSFSRFIASLLIALIIVSVACSPATPDLSQDLETDSVTPTVQALAPVVSATEESTPVSTEGDTPIPTVEIALRATDPYPAPTTEPTANPRAADAYPVVALEDLEITPSSQFHTCNFSISYPSLTAQTEPFTIPSPQVVITNTRGFRLVDWLPDNQHLLVTQSVSEIPDGQDSPVYVGESIETVNTSSGATAQYVTSKLLGLPSWYEANQSVIYVEEIGEQRILQEVTAGTRSPNTLHTGLGSPFFNIHPDAITFIDDADPVQLSEMALSDNRAISTMMPFLPLVYDSGITTARHVLGSPNGSYLALYDADDFMLANVVNNTACYLDQQFVESTNPEGAQIIQAEWSPNSRYLALVLNPDGVGSLVSQTALVIIDTQTNEAKVIYAINSGSAWNYSIVDFAWSSNNTSLLVVGKVEAAPGANQRLNLVNVENLTAQLGQEEFRIGHWGTSLNWSPDGSKIALNCPTETEGRICIYDASSIGE